MRLLIAIPVFNEHKYLEPVLEKVKRFWPEILVVDDGSTDGTAEVLAGRDDIRLVRHQSNLGYGQSIIDAFAYADEHGYDWVVTMDCDEQHEPEAIPAFIEKTRRDRWDLISGSRYLRPSAQDDLPPSDRRNINGIITQKINELLGLGITDAFCGFKAHRVSAMRRLNLTESGYAFPMQLWPRVAKAKLQVVEIPVRLIYNDPNRHFGGMLDKADCRLNHYLKVLGSEMERAEPAATPEPVATNGCCCCK